MNTLIPLCNKNIGTETNSVNSRDLHSFIQAKSDYSTWIKNRIKKYGFKENQDYIIIQTKRAGNNATLKEYFITRDVAKELSMVENNEKGREARRYFIEVDKRYHSNSSEIPNSSNEVLELQQTILEQNKLIATQSKNDVFMNDPSLHNNFLEFLYQANKAVYATNDIKHTSQQLADAHQSLYHFMSFITKRYEKIRGVGKYAVKQITQ